jgi:hypothetical protein
MVQIKGSAIKETIDQIRSRAEEAALQKILGLSTKKRARLAKAKSLLSTGTRSTSSYALSKSRFAFLPTLFRTCHRVAMTGVQKRRTLKLHSKRPRVLWSDGNL